MFAADGAVSGTGARSEQFQASLNGQPIEAVQQQVRYAANGRDTRIHTVKLGPYRSYEATLRPNQLTKGILKEVS